MKPLTPEEKRVIVGKGTEAPFTGKYYRHDDQGVYRCRQCGAPLYRSEDKFDAGCGWPSFDDEIPGAVRRSRDADGRRTEITCARCGGHLGHVFTGEGFTPKNTRHCVNSLSLDFLPASASSGPAAASAPLSVPLFPTAESLSGPAGSASGSSVPLGPSVSNSSVGRASGVSGPAEPSTGSASGSITVPVASDPTRDTSSGSSASKLFGPAESSTPVGPRHDAASRTSDSERRLETAIYAGGCFWGVEHLLSGVPGVLDVESGYIGGTTEHPTYREVCSHRTGHAEAVRVTFDPAKVSYEELTRLFFEIHDPTQADGQGPDLGDQYRSEIFYTSPSQRRTAERLIALLRAKGYDITTQVTPATTFWPAEEYHQDYYRKKGTQPYCHRYTRRF